MLFLSGTIHTGTRRNLQVNSTYRDCIDTNNSYGYLITGRDSKYLQMQSRRLTTVLSQSDFADI